MEEMFSTDNYYIDDSSVIHFKVSEKKYTDITIDSFNDISYIFYPLDNNELQETKQDEQHEQHEQDKNDDFDIEFINGSQNLNEYIFIESTKTVLSKLFDKSLLSDKQLKTQVLTYKSKCLLYEYIDTIRCYKIYPSNIYVYNAPELFTPVTYSNTNIARYVNNLTHGKDYYNYSQHSCKYVSIDGVHFLIKKLKKNRYGAPMEYLSVLETIFDILKNQKVKPEKRKKTFEIIEQPLKKQKIKFEPFEPIKPIKPIKETKEKIKFEPIIDTIKKCKTSSNSNTSKETTLWMKYFNMVKNYALKYNMKKIYFDDESFNLKKWCTCQKSLRKKGSLADEKVKLLESIKGFHWESYNEPSSKTNKGRWNIMFEKLKAYCNTLNNKPLSFERHKNVKLVTWCQAQKANLKRNQLSFNSYKKLCELPGFHWGQYVQRKCGSVIIEHIEYPTTV